MGRLLVYTVTNTRIRERDLVHQLKKRKRKSKQKWKLVSVAHDTHPYELEPPCADHSQGLQPRG